MRPKVILSAIASAAIMLALAFYYRFMPQAPPVAKPAGAVPVASAPAPKQELWAITAHTADQVPLPAATADEAFKDDPITARLVQLGDLSTSNDVTCLKNIVSDLNNPNPKIRHAALEATIQFGSPEAIPALRNAIEMTDDPREKVALQEAIDELQLPPPPGASSSNPPSN